MHTYGFKYVVLAVSTQARLKNFQNITNMEVVMLNIRYIR